MTQNNQGSYGLQWPKWYVYWRGRWWMHGKFSCCPNCYSSPPSLDCLVCCGTYEYGYNATPRRKRQWLIRWNVMKGRK